MLLWFFWGGSGFPYKGDSWIRYLERVKWNSHLPLRFLPDLQLYLESEYGGGTDSVRACTLAPWCPTTCWRAICSILWDRMKTIEVRIEKDSLEQGLSSSFHHGQMAAEDHGDIMGVCSNHWRQCCVVGKIQARSSFIFCKLNLQRKHSRNWWSNKKLGHQVYQLMCFKHSQTN